MSRYKVAVIIPVFNQWSLTEQCLRSLREHSAREDVQVVVVDNGSTDETATSCTSLGRALFGSRFHCERVESNLNFGPGCNLGVTHTDADFLFFLNNDTLVTSGWLEPLLDVFDARSECGAAGPLLLYPGEDRVQHLGVTFTPNMHVDHLYHHFPATHRVIRRRRVLQAITGAAIMTPVNVFSQAGRFCEEYRNGYEDLDLCWQIKSLGLMLWVEPSSKIYHLTSQSAGRFDAENYNFQVLLRRCNKAFVPDLHCFAVDDGFEVSLSPTLRPRLVHVRPPDEAHIVGVDRLWAEVLAEPLWEEGYERLLDLLSKRGLWEAALDLLQMQLCFFSDERVYMNLARIGTKLRNEEVLNICRVALEDLRREAAPNHVVKRFLSLRIWAESANDAVLLSLCRDWAARHMPGRG